MQSIKACLMDDFSGEGLKGIALNTDRFNEDLYKKPEYGAKIRCD